MNILTQSQTSAWKSWYQESPHIMTRYQPWLSPAIPGSPGKKKEKEKKKTSKIYTYSQSTF